MPQGWFTRLDIFLLTLEHSSMICCPLLLFSEVQMSPSCLCLDVAVITSTWQVAPGAGVVSPSPCPRLFIPTRGVTVFSYIFFWFF